MASSSQWIDVPTHGLCFYHCVGHALRGGVSDFNVADARALRVEVCRALVDMNFEQETGRLMLGGSAGYPDELAFLAVTRILRGRLEVVSQEGVSHSYGSGTFRLRIVQTVVYDGVGHGSPHLQIAAMDHTTTGGTDTSMDSTESALNAAYDRLGVGLSHRSVRMPVGAGRDGEVGGRHNDGSRSVASVRGGGRRQGSVVRFGRLVLLT